MATLVIGDVHGQYSQLRALLAKAKQAKLVFVGDLVGRGPASLDVLRMIADFGTRAQVVLGNHDLHLLWSYYSGEQPDPSLEKVMGAHDAQQLCTWLRSQNLAISLPHEQALVVHAGAWHGWDTKQVLELAAEVETALSGPNHVEALKGLYGNDWLQWEEKMQQQARWQVVVNMLTRMRVCKPDGAMDLSYAGRPGEKISAPLVAWYDMPRRRLADWKVICGHWSSLGLLMRKDIAMLDTGCCFGGPLTGLWLEECRLVFSF